MDRLLQNSSIDLDKKIIACENAFHISMSSEENPITNGEDSSKQLLQMIENTRHYSLEQTALAWIISQLDHEIKPPTSMYDNESFMLEMKDRGTLWSCLFNICTLYPTIAERSFLNAKQQPCEFIVKSIAEGIDVNSTLETSSNIFKLIAQFILRSENISNSLFRQPLSYNQAIAKLIEVSQKDSPCMESRVSLDLKFILQHYKKFLLQVHANITDGGCLDIDSIEGNFLEVILPVLIDEDINIIAQDVELNETITEILFRVLFKRERLISDWKDFMYSLTVPDRKPAPNTDHIEKLLYFLQLNTKENNRVFKLLPILFKAILMTGAKENHQENLNVITFTQKEIVLFFVMCSYILKIGPLPTSLPSQIILDSSLAACKITGMIDEKSRLEERLFVFGNLVKILSNYSSSSSLVSVEFNTNEDDNLESSMQFITWLKLCLKDLLETKVHKNHTETSWKNTYSSISVVTNMMKLDSRIVESLIGCILGNVLFKKSSQFLNTKESEMTSSPFEPKPGLTCQVTRTQFMTELFLTYSKLRQIPKLIAKFFLCLQYKDVAASEEQEPKKAYPFSSDNVFNANDLIICGSYISKLPNAQLIEVFKTFSYHLESIETSLVKASLLSQKDLKSEYYVNILNLSNQLIPCFLENSTMSDHLVPISIKEKFIQLMIKMHESIKLKFNSHLGLVTNVLLGLSQLASLMMSYDCFERNSELKRGLQSIVTETEPFEKEAKKLISGSKRKLDTNSPKDRKRKKKALDNLDMNNPKDDFSILQSDLLEKVVDFTDEDYYKTANLIWTYMAREDDLLANSENAWLSTLIAENIKLQNAVLCVSIEAFAPYFEKNSSIPTNFKTAFQYLYNRRSGIARDDSNKDKSEIPPNEKLTDQDIIFEAAQAFGNFSIKELPKNFDLDVSLKTEDITSFINVFGKLLPLELTQGNLESTTSLLLCNLLVLAPSQNIVFQNCVIASLLRCWDTTYRTTNILRYIPFGKLLRLVCRLEINVSSVKQKGLNLKLFNEIYHDVPLTMQLAKIGVSLQSNSEKANPLLDLNDGTMKMLCDAVTLFFKNKNKADFNFDDKDVIKSDTMCSVALMRSIEAFILAPGQNNKTSNSKTMQDQKSKNISYFSIFGENFLLGLKSLNINHEESVKSSLSSNDNSSKRLKNSFDKMTVVISGVSACMTLKSRIPSLDLSSVENSLMVIVKFALKFVSSVINTNDDSNDTNLRYINQYFHFLKTTCKYVSISETYSKTNSLPILHIWQYFLSSKVFQLNECIQGQVFANTIEQYENELFETMLTTFKNKDLFKDLVNSLLERLKAEVTSIDNRERFCRLMNIVANLANLNLEAESDKNYEVRQTALERVIQIIQVIFEE